MIVLDRIPEKDETRKRRESTSVLDVVNLELEPLRYDELARLTDSYSRWVYLAAWLLYVTVMLTQAA